MNYYEELGVAPAASTEEIRLAYKTLARLLHPDQHPEGPMREMAERQMKRLNLMLEVLADPQARQRYDRSLEPAAPVPEPAGLPRRPWGRPGLWIWGTAALLGVAGFGWFLALEGGAGSTPRAVPPVASAPAVAPKSEPAAAAESHPPRARAADTSQREAALAAELERAQRAMEALRAERDDALQQVARQRTRPAQADAAPAAEARVTTPVPPPADTIAPRASNPPVEKPAPRFAGEWLYVKPAHPGKQRGLYPPEYIELKITEKDSVVWGNYHARYWVADQAISPVVAFDFEGRAEVPIARFSWTGAGGAHGQVTLKLNSADAMEVDWRADQLGGEQGLTSGVATLIRRQ